MQNYIKYKNHLLAKNSDASLMLSAANKLVGKDREVMLKKLDAHLRDVDRRAEELKK
jgi:hypothetical protein